MAVEIHESGGSEQDLRKTNKCSYIFVGGAVA